MHEVLGKAITFQTSSIIFSLTRHFFSADAHDLEAAGLFVLWLFFFPPDLMLSWLPSCWLGRVAVSKGLCHSLGFLSIPYVPGSYGSLDVTLDWDPNMNVHVNHFIPDFTSMLSASRMWKEASSSLASARRWAAFIYCIKFRYNWCLVLTESFFFTPSPSSLWSAGLFHMGV